MEALQFIAENIDRSSTELLPESPAPKAMMLLLYGLIWESK
jgi:hypothetical protein